MRIYLPFIFFFLVSCQSIKSRKALKNANQVTFDKKGHYSQIAFERRLGQIVLNATFINNGNSYSGDFFLDTGGINAINDEIQDSLNLANLSDTEITDSGDKKKQVDISIIDELQINNLSISNVGVVNTNFTDFEIFTCIGVGSLGPSIMQGHLWHFNMNDQLITISNSPSLLDSLLEQPHFTAPIKLDRQKRPILVIDINGKRKNILFDTGANGFLSHSYDLFSEISIDTTRGTFLKVNNKTQHGASVTYDRSMHYLMADFTIGNLTVNNAFTTVKNSDMFLIGNKLMDHYHVTFDYPNKKMYFHPIKDHSVPEEYLSHGLGFDWSNDGLTVGGLIKGGPAMRSDIQEGDIILKINGEAPNYKDYCEFLLEDLNLSDTLMLVIKRGDLLFEKEIIKEKLL